MDVRAVSEIYLIRCIVHVLTHMNNTKFVSRYRLDIKTLQFATVIAVIMSAFTTDIEHILVSVSFVN